MKFCEIQMSASIINIYFLRKRGEKTSVFCRLIVTSFTFNEVMVLPPSAQWIIKAITGSRGQDTKYQYSSQ